METSKVELFRNERESNAVSCAAMIEDVLRDLGHDPTAARAIDSHEERAWSIRQGSATVTVGLSNRADYVYLRVVAPVLTVNPTVDTNRLFARLLQLNAREVTGAAFATAGDEVQIVSERSTIDLDRSEVRDVIARVSKYADDWDDRLVEEYGGTLGRVG